MAFRKNNMAYNETFGKCKFCGADMVKSPKTGKVFCSEKCWLKEPKPYTNDQAKSAEIKGFQENKETSMRIMSSGRDAVQIVVAEMNQGIPLDDIQWSEEVIKRHVEKWRNYFYNTIYVDKPF
jgi:hypothetical protein